MYSELANDLQQRVGRSSVAAGACRGRLVAWSSQQLLLLFSCQAHVMMTCSRRRTVFSHALRAVKGVKGVCLVMRSEQAAQTRVS